MARGMLQLSRLLPQGFYLCLGLSEFPGGQRGHLIRQPGSVHGGRVVHGQDRGEFQVVGAAALGGADYPVTAVRRGGPSVAAVKFRILQGDQIRRSGQQFGDSGFGEGRQQAVGMAFTGVAALTARQAGQGDAGSLVELQPQGDFVGLPGKSAPAVGSQIAPALKGGYSVQDAVRVGLTMGFGFMVAGSGRFSSPQWYNSRLRRT